MVFPARTNAKLSCDEVMKQNHNHNPKRHRGRSNGRRGPHGANSSMESNGPEVKIRGNATQLCEKYQSLARDAVTSGDRIAAESYLQHAEHYFRVMTANDRDSDERANRPQPQPANVENQSNSASAEVQPTRRE